MRLVLDPRERALALFAGEDVLGPDDCQVCEQCGIVADFPTGPVAFACVADPTECRLREDPKRANIGRYIEAGLRALEPDA